MKRIILKLKRNPWLKTGIGILSTLSLATIILACCMFYTTGSFRTTWKRFQTTLLTSYCLHVVQSGSNVLRYIEAKDNTVEGSLIVQMFQTRIPIHTYIAHADDVDLNAIVQAARTQTEEIENEQWASNPQADFLYYNGAVGGTMQVLQAQESDGAIETMNEMGSSELNIVTGESYLEDDTTEALPAIGTATKKEFYQLEQLKDFNFLVNRCYIVDGSTSATKEIFDAAKFIKKDFSMNINKNKPQVLIYHTHSQETFYDSRSGVVSDSIVGVGDVLARILEEQYGMNVIHDTTTYDLIDGKLERSLCYSVALPAIEKILEYNPSIEVIIDLHRDGLREGMKQADGKRVTTIDGKDCAQIMLFNGLSRNENGPITYLPNKNLEGNLAFSFQMFLEGKNTYPDLMKPIYLKSYRFNLHLKEKSLLVELGTQYNTVEEAKNSMPYLAQLLSSVLSGK